MYNIYLRGTATEAGYFCLCPVCLKRVLKYAHARLDVSDSGCIKRQIPNQLKASLWQRWLKGPQEKQLNNLPRLPEPSRH